MTAVQDAPTTSQAPAAAAGLVTRGVAFVGTVLVIIALAILPLLTPLFIHPGLDAADSAARLGVTAAEAYEMSDRSVQELVLGPGTFAFAGRDGSSFYDPSERSHLRDARLLLWVFLAAGALSAALIGVALARASRAAGASIWRSISLAGAASAITVVVAGILSLVAFGALFRLFHQVFFPAGNWAFDPATQRMVQLYPFGFWQIAAGALGLLVLVLGIAAWWLGRTMARRTLPTARG